MNSDRGEKGVPFCSITIPCYNEAGSIPSLLDGFSRALKVTDIELILVDNGSSDGTAAILESLAPGYPFVRVVSCSSNRGYGGGILSGLSEARGDFAGWAHGDLQYSPADILETAEALRPLRGKDVFLKGLRKNRSATDSFFTAGMSAFASLTLGLPLKDINAQPTFFSRSLLKYWQAPPQDFSLDLYAYVTALRRGFKVLRREVFLAKRKEGSSSWNRGLADRLRLSVRMAGTILRSRAKFRGPAADA